MKIRMKTTISGVRDGEPWPDQGQSMDVPDEEGTDLCASGLAEPLDGRDEPETATPNQSYVDTRQGATEVPAPQMPTSQGPSLPPVSPPVTPPAPPAQPSVMTTQPEA